MVEPNSNWTPFFDREVVQQYRDFMKTRDPDRTRLQLSISNDNASRQTSWDPPPIPPKGHVHIDTPTSVPEYARVLYPHGKSQRIAEEKNKRDKYTMSFVIAAILVLSLVALLTALLIHYLIIDNKDHHSTFPDLAGNNITSYQPTGNSTITTTESTTTVHITKDASISSTTVAPAIPAAYDLKNVTTPVTTVTTPVRTTRAHVETVTTPVLNVTAKVDTVTTAVDNVTTSTQYVTTTVGEAPSIRLTNVSAVVGDHVTLTCKLENGGTWKSLSILQTKPAFSILVTLHAGSNQTNVWPDPRLQTMFVAVDGDVELMLAIAPTACSDHGNYRCSAELEDKVIFNEQEVIINGPDIGPIISSQTYMVEKELAQISANWTLGAKDSAGQVIWEVQYSNDSQFRPVDVKDVTQEPIRGDCSTEFHNVFYVWVEAKMNNSLLRVKIELEGESHTIPLVSEPVLLLVIPAALCLNKPDGSLIEHPYTCENFIQCKNATINIYNCFQDECFDGLALQCLPVPRFG